MINSKWLLLQTFACSLLVSAAARCESLPTIIGHYEVAGEFELVGNVIKSPGKGAGFLTQSSRYLRKSTGHFLSFEIEFMPNQIAHLYSLPAGLKSADDVKLGVWKYRFIEDKDGKAGKLPLELRAQAPGYGKVSVSIDSNDPQFTRSELINLLKRSPIDLEKAAGIVLLSKPYAKQMKSGKEGANTLIGTWPFKDRQYIDHDEKYVKQVDFPGQLEHASGQSVGFMSNDGFIDGHMEDTVMESICGKFIDNDADLESFFLKFQPMLFTEKFTAFSKSDFTTGDFVGTIETGDVAVNSRTYFEGFIPHIARLVKIKKGNEFHIIRIISDPADWALQRDFVETLRQVKLQCLPANVMKMELEKA